MKFLYFRKLNFDQSEDKKNKFSLIVFTTTTTKKIAKTSGHGNNAFLHPLWI